MNRTKEQHMKIAQNWYGLAGDQERYTGGPVTSAQIQPQLEAGLSYIDARYGNRRSRARRHLRQAVHHLRLAVSELTR